MKLITSNKTLAVLLMASALFTACSSDDNVHDGSAVEAPTQATYTMTIQATKATGDDAQTRGLSLVDKTLSVKWNEGEVVKVAQNGSVIGTLTAQASTSGTTTLIGTLTGVDANEAISFFLHDNIFDYTGQTGVLFKADDSVNSIEDNYDYAFCRVTSDKVNVNGTEVTIDGGVTFKSWQAIVKFTFTDKATAAPIAVNSLTISQSGNNIIKQYDNLSNSSTYDKLTVTPATPTSEIYVALSDAIQQAASYFLTVSAADGVYTYEKSDVKFTAGKYYEINVTMMRKYVDLGLSVKWATANVGAASETDYGLYFSWGDTTGYAYGSGHSFSDVNDKWYDSSARTHTKYDYFPEGGFDYTELEPADDAATQNWGSGWRMPTKAEWEELLNEANCTWTWTTDYKGTSVAGAIVTSKKAGYTDKSIFLPAAGRCSWDNNTAPGIWTHYWSKNLDTEILMVSRDYPSVSSSKDSSAFWRATFLMAVSWPATAAKGANWAARAIFDMRG